MGNLSHKTDTGTGSHFLLAEAVKPKENVLVPARILFLILIKFFNVLPRSGSAFVLKAGSGLT
jgi:hypothetical protein